MSWQVELRGRVGELHLDIEIDGGEEPVVLVGANGSGKSTLLRWIAGQPLPGAEGRVRVEGEVLFDDAKGIDLPPERRGVGYVPQGFALFEHLSALDNVAFGLAARGRPRAARREAAKAALTDLGGAHLAGRAPGTLSGGERQKVALARALVLAPRLLLLDEPMAALDVAARRRLRAFLAERLRSARALVVTHDARDARALSSDVAVLDAGRIVQRGAPESLAAEPANELVAELFGAPSMPAR